MEKRDIFLTQSDRIRFQRLLRLANGEKPIVYRLVQSLALDEVDVGERSVAIGAYCLMPNHFHILVKEIKEGGLTDFMQKLSTGYSKYFNKVNKRVGPLFQSRFKAQHVDRDEYLKYLFAYIHLNPVKLIEPDWKEEGIQDSEKARIYLDNYAFSSYQDLTGHRRDESAILAPAEFPGYFDTPMDFERFVQDWLEFREEAKMEEAPSANIVTKGELG